MFPENIEYCIQIMNGTVTPPVTKYQSSIKLARYDISFVQNATFFINNGQGLTELQRNLAIKLTNKYRRQYKKMGIYIDKIVENPVWATPLRKVDRTKSFDVDNESIYLKFPYDQERIKELHQQIRDGQLITEGSQSNWKQTERYWKFDLIEPNMVLLWSWARDNGFVPSDDAKKIYDKYQEIQLNKKKYSIHAIVEDGKLKIQNAPEELQEYWNTNIAKLDIKEQIKSCTDLAIKIDFDLLNYYNYNSIQQKILSDRKINLDCTLKEAVFNCLDLGYDKIAIGLNSHSPKNILEVKGIKSVFISRGYEPSQFVVNAKNTALNNASEFHLADETTKIVVTDRMSRLNNTTFNFECDVMIGYGMYSQRSLFNSNKVISLPPVEEQEELPF